MAVVRAAGGDVRVLVDGAAAPNVRGGGRFAGELAFESIAVQPAFFLHGGAVDVAEFALFDAALTDDQVRKLAGLGAAR